MYKALQCLTDNAMRWHWNRTLKNRELGGWICLDLGDLKFDAVKGFVECERGEKLMQQAIMGVMNMEHSSAAAMNPIFSEKCLTDINVCIAFLINNKIMYYLFIIYICLQKIQLNWHYRVWTEHSIKSVVHLLGEATSCKQEWSNKGSGGHWERQRRLLEKEQKIEVMTEEGKEWDKE